MNHLALVGNARWKACLLAALAIVGLVAGSAKAQTQPIFPVATQVSLPPESTPVFIGDFNGDGVPDLAAYTIGSNAPVTLSILLSFGSNASTTTTTTLCTGTPAISFADVNNDKKLDLVFYCNGYLTIQLGNGDGTFQSPAYFPSNSFGPVLVDLNGDGYLDIAGLVGSTQANMPPQVAVYMNGGSTGPGVFASPKLYAAPNTAYGLLAGDFNGDGKQDLLAATYASLPILTGVSVFYGNGAAGSTSLGTATLTAGVATLQTSFATAGSYAVTAAYAGDQNNAASTSSAVTITIAAPDFTIAATPTSASVTPGQTATFTFTVTPVAGYSGTVKFSCGTLPSMAVCAFTPSSVAPSGSSPVSSTLTVTTAGTQAMLKMERRSGPSLPPWIPAGGLAFAGAMGLVCAPRKIRGWHRSLRPLSWGLLLASVSLSVLSCGGGNSAPSNPGTPAGSYTLSVNASDSAGGPQHAVSVTLSVQ